jgi:AdoMet-dependent rRNA methyltransferase SPB1
MLRKKDREEIINSSYSRYALDEGDEENLPSWFLEEERSHNFLSLPVTKEEVEEEKQRLYAIN